MPHGKRSAASATWPRTIRCMAICWCATIWGSSPTCGSSPVPHALPEVQHTCSRLLIISRGKIVADGPVDRLIRQAEGAVEIAVEAAGTGVAEALGRLPGVRQVSPAGPATDGRVALTLTADRSTDLRPEIFGLAKAQGWTLYGLHQAAGRLADR